MRKQKCGFTLVELIAVIVVLAVILAIAVPTITSVIRSSTMSAFESDTKMVLDTIRIKLLEDPNLDPTTIDETNISDKLGVSNENYEDLKIEVNNGMRYIDVDGKGKWAGFSACGTFFSIQVNEGACANDFYAPVITLLGTSPITIEVGSTYTDAGATATDDVDGNITNKIVVTGTVNPNIVGTYVMSYDVSDNAGHNAVTLTRTVNVIDTTNPTITFGMNGNATYAKTRSTTVTVSDAGGINASSLKYLWTTSTTAPTEVSFTTTFINGGTITSPAGVTGGYYLWILAKDNQNNTIIASSNIFNLDNTIPVITMNGSSPVNIYISQTYTDAGATATDAHSGVGAVIQTGSVDINTVGTYTINYNVSDNAGNAAMQVSRTVNVLDNIAPTVAFGTNGNSAYAKNASTTVTVGDNVGVNASSLKYQWTTSTTAPSEASYTTSFTSGGTISTPAGVTGLYYLWIIAKDTSGIGVTARTFGFYLDNTAPVITMNGSNPINVIQGSTYSDAGATATDAHSGVGSVIATGTVNINTLGTYYIYYNVSDNAGNAATQVTRTINVISGATNFAYNGNIQTFIPSVTGYYKLEVWGASGASAFNGKGGYAIGALYMTQGTTYYVVVGGTSVDIPGGYNGGGYGGNGNASNTKGGGGGATHIATATGLLSTLSSNQSAVKIVAGAGGGQAYNGDYYSVRSGGNGGGTVGGNNYGGSAGTRYAYGGTQTAGGAGASTNGNSGSFGQGGNTTSSTDSGGYMIYRGGGGGGGWYGGGAGNSGLYEYMSYISGGAGGSSYIGGVTTYGGVTASTISGDTSMPAPAGGTETGHTGNGYAKITYIGS